ncbi:hypothetical protein, partial [Azospirillum sp. B4]|uniref:hypothetical protein n=1 Tax=Azospirillum sp. B4 TaxID=95605 RepID=UPI0019012200
MGGPVGAAVARHAAAVTKTIGKLLGQLLAWAAAVGTWWGAMCLLMGEAFEFSAWRPDQWRQLGNALMAGQPIWFDSHLGAARVDLLWLASWVTGLLVLPILLGNATKLKRLVLEGVSRITLTRSPRRHGRKAASELRLRALLQRFSSPVSVQLPSGAGKEGLESQQHGTVPPAAVPPIPSPPPAASGEGASGGLPSGHTLAEEEAMLRSLEALEAAAARVGRGGQVGEGVGSGEAAPAAAQPTSGQPHDAGAVADLLAEDVVRRHGSAGPTTTPEPSPEREISPEGETGGTRNSDEEADPPDIPDEVGHLLEELAEDEGEDLNEEEGWENVRLVAPFQPIGTLDAEARDLVLGVVESLRRRE